MTDRHRHTHTILGPRCCVVTICRITFPSFKSLKPSAGVTIPGGRRLHCHACVFQIKNIQIRPQGSDLGKNSVSNFRSLFWHARPLARVETRTSCVAKIEKTANTVLFGHGNKASTSETCDRGHGVTGVDAQSQNLSGVDRRGRTDTKTLKRGSGSGASRRALNSRSGISTR